MRSGAGDSASEGALGCRHLLLLVSACGTKRGNLLFYHLDVKYGYRKSTIIELKSVKYHPLAFSVIPVSEGKPVIGTVWQTHSPETSNQNSLSPKVIDKSWGFKRDG